MLLLPELISQAARYLRDICSTSSTVITGARFTALRTFVCLLSPPCCATGRHHNGERAVSGLQHSRFSDPSKQQNNSPPNRLSGGAAARPARRASRDPGSPW